MRITLLVFGSNKLIIYLCLFIYFGDIKLEKNQFAFIYIIVTLPYSFEKNEILRKIKSSNNKTFPPLRSNLFIRVRLFNPFVFYFYVNLLYVVD